MKIHFHRGVETPTPCGAKGTSSNDTDLVTCARCSSHPDYQKAATEYREVVEALAYPKEEHPCLTASSTTPTRPSSPRGGPPAGRTTAPTK